ncbi:ATP-dependent DNA helicase [Deltaproteobacteria bacterium]|nr:ATP-dependent DNA helicase [Deltaproteobacteria bacterium]
MTDYNNSKKPDNPPFLDEAPPHTDDDYLIPDISLEQVEKVDHAIPKTTNINWDRKKYSPAAVNGKRDKKDLHVNPVSILKEIFHFDSFRPYQQKVCESVIRGNDMLLVMPTGAGKSLCYQLPGIARGGTTLVVSPLIALMEDQTSGLKGQGLMAERIHSGRTPIQSRNVCGEYLAGNLDFLFIAPERLAVPGFPEMLARQKPTLIAVDEAHCISQWGHDFRPDYRLLGERLPILRPAPVIAMTATATPRVQEDIIRQLCIDGADMGIHGFRRTNIAIELAELMPSERTQKVLEILKNKEYRPAIIYAPTRQKAEDLAEEIKNVFSAASYHAGLAPDVRDKVQASFLSGEIDVIVATIAFGMGIDKPDIRTVIHTALPGSLEGYYQEIGRAGRDGKSSRAILLHSYGDRRVHHFFHEKSYPEEIVLKRIYDRLKRDKIPSKKLCEDLNMDEDEFETALDKLWIHGGAQVDPDETVTRGHDKWHITYRKQSYHRLSQIDEMSSFTSSFSCRMLYLVKHFGDREDKGSGCGLCDFCAPQDRVASLSREPDSRESGIISEVIAALKSTGGLSTGKLYSSACPGSVFPRSDFESLLRSLVNADLINISEHIFEKDGREIHYKKAELTNKGYSFSPEHIPSIVVTTSGVLKKTTGKKLSTKKRDSRKVIRPSGKGMSENLELYSRLKEWRLSKAKKRGLPAFRIFTNKVLDNLSSDMPTTHDELLMVNGVGPYFSQQYGNEIIRIVKEHLGKND